MRQNTETITIAIYHLFEMVHRSSINGTVYQDRALGYPPHLIWGYMIQTNGVE